MTLISVDLSHLTYRQKGKRRTDRRPRVRENVIQNQLNHPFGVGEGNPLVIQYHSSPREKSNLDSAKTVYGTKNPSGGSVGDRRGEMALR